MEEISEKREDDDQMMSETDDGLRNLIAACLQEEPNEKNQDLDSSTEKNSEVSPISVENKLKSSGRQKRKAITEFTKDDLVRFRLPLDKCYRRELVWRSNANVMQSGKKVTNVGDVYYYPPNSTTKLRSINEVSAYIDKNLVDDLSVDNFTFLKLLIGHERESERGARSTTVSPQISKSPLKKVKVAASAMIQSKSPTPSMKSIVSDEDDERSLNIATPTSVASCSSSLEAKKKRSIKQEDSDSESLSNLKKLKKFSLLDEAESPSITTSMNKTGGSSAKGSPPAAGLKKSRPEQMISKSEHSKSKSSKVKKFKSMAQIEREKALKLVEKEAKAKKLIEEAACSKPVTPESCSRKSASPLSQQLLMHPPCPGDVCDMRIPCQVICASCLVQFHIQCCAAHGKVVTTSKQENLFMCNICYHDEMTLPKSLSESKMDGSDGDFLITKSISNVLKHGRTIETQTIDLEFVQHLQRANWMKDVCSYVQVLKLVFKQLTVVDLLRVKCVCKTWYDVSSLPEVWKFASLAQCSIKDWTKAAVFFRQRQVQILDFFGVRTTVSAFTMGLKEMDFLSGFHFGCVVPVVLTSLKDSPKVLSRLDYLRVTVTEQKKPTTVDESFVDVDCELFKHMLNLKTLRLTSARSFSIRLQNYMCLNTLQQLTTLVLLDITSENDTYLGCLQLMTSLKNLQLGYCSNFTKKAYEIISKLRNLEQLRLECSENQPTSEYVLSTIVSLPKLKHLCLTKFPLSRYSMDIISKKRLTSFTLWPDFHSKNAVNNWKSMIDTVHAMNGQSTFLTLGILSKTLKVIKRQVFDIDQNFKSPVRFAELDEKGDIKSIRIDEFILFAKRYLSKVEYKYIKDDSLALTRGDSR